MSTIALLPYEGCPTRRDPGALLVGAPVLTSRRPNALHSRRTGALHMRQMQQGGGGVA